MAPKIPNLLFFGAGNIAQSIIKGLIRVEPGASEQILATAPSLRNLQNIDKNLLCRTALLEELSEEKLTLFDPKCVFLCMKPQSFLKSFSRNRNDNLHKLLSNLPLECTIVSMVAGIHGNLQWQLMDLPTQKEFTFVRAMLNTASEVGLTSVFYLPNERADITPEKKVMLENIFGLIGKPVIRLNDDGIMDVATGVCGSGIALFYEMIQAFSDSAVKNGLPRRESTEVAAQLAKAAGEMILKKEVHPYQLRDEVASPAGTTIYGISKWHDLSINQSISQAVQASIDRSKILAEYANKLPPSKET